MAGKGSPGGVPAPVVAGPGAPAPQSGGVTEALAGQQRLDDYVQRMMAGMAGRAPARYGGSPLAGYGGPKLPALPPTAQYGPRGFQPRPQQPTRGFSPTTSQANMLQPFLNMLMPQPRQPAAQQPRPPAPAPGGTAIEHVRTEPLPYNQPFIPQPYGLEAVKDYSIQRLNVGGRDMYRFEVRNGDVQPWDVGNIGPGGSANERAEIRYTEGASAAKGSSPYNATPTTGRVQYGMGLQFDPSFPLDQRWAMLLQFHPTDQGQTGGGMGGSFGGLAVHNGYLDATSPTDGKNFLHVPIDRNHYYDLKFDVNWTNQNNGYVKIYDGSNLLGQFNGPTITAPYAYLKQGYYRDGGTTDTGIVYETPVNITIPR